VTGVRPTSRSSQGWERDSRGRDATGPHRLAFRFIHTDGLGPVVAHNVRELCEAVRIVPAAAPDRDEILDHVRDRYVL